MTYNHSEIAKLVALHFKNLIAEGLDAYIALQLTINYQLILVSATDNHNMIEVDDWPQKDNDGTHNNRQFPPTGDSP